MRTAHLGAGGLLLGLLPVLCGSEIPLTNAGFDSGLAGWAVSTGPADSVRVLPLPGADGQAVQLSPRGTNLGIDSEVLRLGEDLTATKTYAVSARARFDGLRSGVAAVSVCAVDAGGRRLVQYPVHSWNTASQPHAWVERTATIGAGTDKPFPENAHGIHLRISFHERQGNSDGDLAVDALRITETQPGTMPLWPAEILATCGDIAVRLESRSFWTLYRIDYRGDRLGVDTFGSHYGSVANVKGTGFIGSGHTENGESEQVDAVELLVDGVPQPTPAGAYTANTVVLRKRSRLRALQLRSTVAVTSSHIDEEVALQAEEPTELNLLYHFMHPWVTAMNDFAALGQDGTITQGTFSGDRGMKIAAPVRWSAVYSRSLGKGAVTLVLEAPAGHPWEVCYWDVPDRYRKHYLKTFANAAVPVGPVFRYRVVTIPFTAPPDGWLATAAERADGFKLAP